MAQQQAKQSLQIERQAHQAPLAGRRFLISRGALIDTPAILDALSPRRLRGAYLDVHDPEPLPGDSSFWRLPNVVITPHNSPASQRGIENMTRIFIENFARYCVEQSLVNVVNKRAGY